MPKHHLVNRMLIKGEPYRISAVFNFIKGRNDNALFDLKSIIPVPDSILIATELLKEKFEIDGYGQSEQDNYRKRCAAAKQRCLVETGFSDCYEWSLSEWGSLGNVFHVMRDDTHTDALYFCSFEWSPLNAIRVLSHIFPEVVIVLDFSEARAPELWRVVFADGDGSSDSYPHDSETGSDIREGLERYGSWHVSGSIEDVSESEDEEWPSIIYTN